MLGFGIRMAITAIGLWIASSWVSGIEVADTATLVWAALLLGIVNAVVRPVIVVLTLPITFLTLGLFLWVINAAMIALVASLLDGLRIAGFGSALIGALILSVTGWLGSAFIGPGGRYEMIVVRGSGLHD
ncbi:MAG: phage holin family protein [Deltaproteobacteria bacterium]|jgi:putative membrane protein|nr:phage holin family protein [Deltaproteobacteria bacterium]